MARCIGVVVMASGALWLWRSAGCITATASWVVTLFTATPQPQQTTNQHEHPNLIQARRNSPLSLERGCSAQRTRRLEIHRATNIDFNNSTQHWEVKDQKGKVRFFARSRSVWLEWERENLQVD
jgi:hypothetical protein